MKLYTIRHGQTDWNKERRFQGRSNVPLNDYGRRLAVETAEGMRDINFDIIYSSPLDRALETARIMQGGRDIPVVADERLIEMSFGVYEGMPAEQIHEVIEAFFNNPAEYVAPEGGESFEDVIARAEDFVENVLVPMSAEKPDANVLVSAHGALLRGIVVYLNHLEISQFWSGPFQANCCVNIFDINGHEIRMLEEAKVYYEQDKAEEDGWKEFAEKSMEQAKIVNLFDLEHSIAGEYLAGFTYPWEALDGISDLIKKLGPALAPDRFEQKGEFVWVARSAKVFDSAYLGAPLIIDEDAEVRQCAFIRGSAIVGKNCVVGNSTELKNVILFDNVQVPHYNYVGDSILGYKSHMGAGSITSNVKSDKTLVVVKDGKEEIATGRKKFGAMLGDNVEVGCNSVLNPGTVIGRNTNVYPLSPVRGVVPADSIWKTGGVIVSKF